LLQFRIERNRHREEAQMPSSTMNADGGRDRVVGKGHGTGALGPSDSSDSGSDVVGGPGLGIAADDIGLDRGTSEDSNIGRGDADATAGADVGDVDLDSDSDRHGTGENIAAGRDSLTVNRDRGIDRVEGPEDPNDWTDERLDADQLELSTDDADAGVDDVATPDALDDAEETEEAQPAGEAAGRKQRSPGRKQR
jgi:hypothetical protein